MSPFDDADTLSRPAGLGRAVMVAVRRDRQLTARLTTAVLGAILLFSPWVFGFVGNVATWSAWGLGFFLARCASHVEQELDDLDPLRFDLSTAWLAQHLRPEMRVLFR